MGNYLSPSIKQPPLISGEEGVKVFTKSELKNLTQKFKKVTETEFRLREVYRGHINPNTLLPAKESNGIAITVEILYNPQEQALQDWLVDLEFLRHNSHPSLVKLIGYGLDSSYLYIVSQDFPNGVLNRHIYRESRPKPLPWEIRLKIAIGAAQCLAFLQLRKNSRLYASFLTASEILLDSEFNPRISYFGLLRLPYHKDSLFIVRKAHKAGGFYSAPPEYIFSGNSDMSGDVYSFGVILLQILTGFEGVRLITEKIAIRNDDDNFGEMIDPGLENKYPLEAGKLMLKLIKQCIEEDPKVRPSMQQVLDDLNAIAQI